MMRSQSTRATTYRSSERDVSMDELQREVLTQRILRILNHQASETVANDIDRLQQTSGGLEDESVQLSG